MQRAAISVIEAAYQTEGSTEDWLRSIARAMPERDHALGHICLTYRINERGQLVFDEIVQVDTPGDLSAVSRTAMCSMPPEYVKATWTAVPCGTALGAGPVEARDQTRAALEHYYGGFGIRDIVVVNGIDPTDQGVYVGALVAEPAPLARRDRSTWSRVAAHLVASYRLRRTAAAEPDAVITPGGKVEHAIEDARSTSAREALRHAALAIDKARAKRSRVDEEDAVQMWQALVSGRWTLVDRLDSDGRRYFIARRNDPDVARHHALTRRERQVVGFAALGHSNKLIAYELGLSISAVAVYLDVAMEKLGVSSRADLIVAARAFGSGER
jgi:DNA-binding CsgD family transcriptional regulator